MKKLLILAICIVMLFVFVVPVGAITSSSGSSSSTPSTKMTISMAVWSIGDALPEKAKADPVRDAFYKKLNITIKPYNVSWSDYTQKILVWAASGQLPDVFAIDSVGVNQNYKKWITQGIVKALPTSLAAYPNLNKLMQAQDFRAYMYPLNAKNAKYYCIPRPNYRDSNMWANDYGVLIRKDYMANVGITKMPTNMDEFITLMKAFVEKDPDKNGKNDTVGLTGYNTQWLPYLMIGYEPGLVTGGSKWVKSNGQWVPAFMTENAVKGVVAIKKLYDAGGIDKDLVTFKAEEGEDKFASGTAGAYIHNVLPGTIKYLADKYIKFNPGKNFADVIAIMKPFKALDGNYYRENDVGPWSETYINAKASSAKVDRILKMFDYALSEDGYNLLHYGIKGVDYNIKNGEIVMTNQKKADGTAVILTEKYPFMKINYMAEWSGSNQYKMPTIPKDMRDMSKAALDWNLKNAKPINTNLMLGFLEYPSKAKATELFYNDLIKAIMSSDAEKTYREIIKNYKANGYDQVIKDFNAAAKSAGMK